MVHICLALLHLSWLLRNPGWLWRRRAVAVAPDGGGGGGNGGGAEGRAGGTAWPLTS